MWSVSVSSWPLTSILFEAGLKQVCSWLSTCLRHAHASLRPGLQPGLQFARILNAAFTYRDGLSVHRRSPILVLTGSNVAQLRWSRPTRYHQAKPPTYNITHFVVQDVLLLLKLKLLHWTVQYRYFESDVWTVGWCRGINNISHSTIQYLNVCYPTFTNVC